MIVIHFSKWYFGDYFGEMPFGVYSFHDRTACLKIADDIAESSSGIKQKQYNSSKICDRLLKSLLESHEAGYFEGDIIGINRMHFTIVYTYPYVAHNDPVVGPPAFFP